MAFLLHTQCVPGMDKGPSHASSDNSTPEHLKPPPEVEVPEIEAPETDHAAETKLVRKLDLHIIWMVVLLYLLSFLDRFASSIRSIASSQASLSLPAL